jgi:uncharacterized membrane protein YkoI
MTNKDVETKLHTAVSHAVPDVLDSILANCGEGNKTVILHPKTAYKSNWLKAAAGATALLAIIVGAALLYKPKQNTPDQTASIYKTEDTYVLASDISLIDEEAALKIAAEYAKINSDEIDEKTVDMEADGDQSVYIVKFNSSGISYTVKVEAATGTVLEFGSRVIK